MFSDTIPVTFLIHSITTYYAPVHKYPTCVPICACITPNSLDFWMQLSVNSCEMQYQSCIE